MSQEDYHMYVLVWYVPESHLEQVKEAVFAAGGGKIGNYEKCCWQCLGQGQFQPGPESDPYIGRKGAIERLQEYRVELVVDESHAFAAVEALLAEHPYETPAYHLIPVMTMSIS